MPNKPHASGDDHWTRRMPERVRRGVDGNGAKLSEDQIAQLIAHARAGVPPTTIARALGVSRQTVWRQLRAAGE